MFDLKKIRIVLNEKGQTIRWLATQLNYKDTAIHKMFKTNNTTVLTLENICKILEITPVRLLDDSLTNSIINQNLNKNEGEKMDRKMIPIEVLEMLNKTIEYERDLHSEHKSDLRYQIDLLSKLVTNSQNGQKKTG